MSEAGLKVRDFLHLQLTNLSPELSQVSCRPKFIIQKINRWACVLLCSFQRTQCSFFCVLYKKNAAFFVFFYVLYKRMLSSLRSFTFFIKERGVETRKSSYRDREKSRNLVIFIPQSVLVIATANTHLNTVAILVSRVECGIFF